MKYTKKLLSLVLVLVLALALAVPGFAAQTVDSGLNGTGTITITNATLEETYSIYKVFDATYAGSDNASYTIKSDSPWYPIVSGNADMFTLTASAGDSSVFVVSFKQGVTGEAVRDYLAGQVSNVAADATAEATDVEVQFTDVAYGYYLVKSTLNGGGTVTVTNAKPDATVIDKNQEPGTGASKTAGDEDYEIGETIPFTVTFIATNYDGAKDIGEYYVKDTMPSGMELIVDSLVVKVNNSELKKAYTENSDTTAAGFDITIPWQDENGDFLYTSPSTVTVTYSAKLTATAGIDGDGVTNTAIIDWDVNSDGSEVKTPETVYTYALAIKKVDKQGNPLAGAEFELKNGDAVVKVSGSNGNYVVDPNGTATITSPESGLIVIKGVDGDDYTLTETKAPAGYNLMTESLTVTPELIGMTTTTVTKHLDENGKVVDEETSIPVTIELGDVAATPVFVVNFTGTELPSTGGMGTTIFYTLGGVLVVGAAILLVTKKRVHDVEG